MILILYIIILVLLGILLILRFIFKKKVGLKKAIFSGVVVYALVAILYIYEASKMPVGTTPVSFEQIENPSSNLTE